VQNFSFKKIQDILQEFQDITEISGHSGHILKFQEFQDHAQACIYRGFSYCSNFLGFSIESSNLVLFTMFTLLIKLHVYLIN